MDPWRYTASRRVVVAGLALSVGLNRSFAAAAPDLRAKRLALDPGHPDVDCLNLWRTEDSRQRPLVVLLPPYGGNAAYFDSSRLPSQLAARGVDLAVAHTHATGYMEQAKLERLDKLLAFVRQHYGRQAATRFAIGGFSAGGYAALRYAQLSRTAGATAFQPSAVFSVDAPLDLARWYAGLEVASARLATRRPDSMFLGEAQYLTGLLRQLMGGTPQQEAREYQQRSVFTASLPDGGNAGQLLTLAVRLYTEPDPEFFISQGLDMMSSNAIDQIALVNVLRLLGHTDVSLVLTHGRGVRPDLGGRRLPHAWSIVDEDDLAAWLAARLGGVPG
ncbi:MAG: hypothetical protein JNN18_18475 [Rubrivivax sp.]|nr:hypothetical protein [Rubrivivax sp.]